MKHKKQLKHVDSIARTRLAFDQDGNRVFIMNPIQMLGFSGYGKYIHSRLWKIIRREFLLERCELCGESAQELHHTSYDLSTLLGNNRCNLVSLCQKCHAKIHVKAGKDVKAVNNLTSSLLSDAGRKVDRLSILQRDAKKFDSSEKVIGHRSSLEPFSPIAYMASHIWQDVKLISKRRECSVCLKPSVSSYPIMNDFETYSGDALYNIVSLCGKCESESGIKCEDDAGYWRGRSKVVEMLVDACRWNWIQERLQSHLSDKHRAGCLSPETHIEIFSKSECCDKKCRPKKVVKDNVATVKDERVKRKPDMRTIITSGERKRAAKFDQLTAQHDFLNFRLYGRQHVH